MDNSLLFHPKIVLFANYYIHSQAEQFQKIFKELSLNIEVAHAANDDLMRELLDPMGLLQNTQSCLSILIFINPDLLISASFHDNYLQLLQEAISSIRSLAKSVFVIWMPATNKNLDQNHCKNILKNIESILFIEALEEDILSDEIFDCTLSRLVNIPYSRNFEKKIAIKFLKELRNEFDTIYKVIVIDADNTLWKGICAEDALNEISIEQQFRELQLFLAECEQKGFLLCIASKNIESDVFHVIDNHPNMIIRRQQITDWEINWENKAVNLYRLAERLNLGLDSFVFIDDNPEECANMVAKNPTVLSVCFGDQGYSLEFIKTLWVFDIRNDGDIKNRTQLYQENAVRLHNLEKSSSYNEFLKMLNISIDLLPLETGCFNRISELSYRTTQFNCANNRLDHTILYNYLQKPYHGYMVSVKDNFGDYGIVGFVSFIVDDKAITIDNFFLSCRILNRGIEYEVIKKISHSYTSMSKNIHVIFNATHRNIPAEKFLESIGLFQYNTSGSMFIISYCQAENLNFNPDEINKDKKLVQLIENTDKLFNSETVLRIAKLELLLKTDLHDVSQVDIDDIKTVLTQIWSKELEIFVSASCFNIELFSLGASSLKAVRIIAAINRKFSLECSVKDIYEYNSLNKMYDFIKEKIAEKVIFSTSENMTVKNKGEISHQYLASVNQRALFILDKIQKAWWYNAPSAFLIIGRLNYSSLSRAFDLLLSMHPQLRANFYFSEEQVYFSENLNRKVFIEHVDMLGASDEEIITYCKRREKDYFDLSHNLLLNVVLIKTNIEKHILFVNVHHIIADGWSENLLYTQLIKIYDELECDESILVTDCQKGQSYEHFCNKQSNWLQSKAYEQQKEYWLKKLKSAYFTEIRADKDIEESISPHDGVFVSFEINVIKYDALRKVAASLNVSFFNLVFTIFNVLIHKYTNEEDILIGVPFWNRSLGNFDDTIGYFVNLVLLRTIISPEKTFLTLLNEVSASISEAQANQDIPFSLLVEHLEAHQSLNNGHEPKIVFVLQQEISLKCDSLQLQKFYRGYNFNRFDFVFELTELSDGVMGGIYHARNYSSSFISGFVNAYLDIVNQIEVLLSDKIKNFIIKSNQNIYDLLSHIDLNFQAESLVELFNLQVKYNPAKIAISYQSQEITYEILDRLVNCVAVNLQIKGYHIGDIVGMALKKSVELIVVTIALVKVGIVYVGLDESHPDDYLRSVITNSQLRLIITEVNLESRFSNFSQTLSLRDIFIEQAEDYYFQFPPINSQNKLYILYTSGTTGQPKGVAITHANFCNLLQVTQKIYYFNNTDKIVFFHSFGFDVGQWEIWSALANGCQLVIPDDSILKLPHQFIDFLDQSKVTVLNQTPSSFEHLCQALNYFNHSPLSSIRLVIFAGESLHPKIIEKFPIAAQQQINFYNMYGITEVTVHTTIKKIELNRLNSRINNVGIPLENTAVLILDNNMQIKPIGAVGEIYVVGYGVAQGYYNNSTFTKSRFNTVREITLPLYKSGDLGRFLGNGDIEFLGRIDEEIKLRGYRLDLKEIANTAKQFSGVQNALILEKGGCFAEKKICIFIIPDLYSCGPVYRINKLKEENPAINFYTLPNDLTIAHINSLETEALYKEIFIQSEYLKNGIAIQEGDVIFDIGANIGMFAIKLAMSLEKVSIHAFEPILPIYQALQNNQYIYDIDNLKIHHLGLHEKTGTIDFTYYPNATVLSTIASSSDNDVKDIMSTYITNKYNDIVLDKNLVDAFIENQLQSKTYSCQVTTISDFIVKNNITKIDLLKIDVERSELSVLNGVKKEHWGLIKQIAMEVHDIDDNLNKIKNLLNENNFSVEVLKNEVLTKTNIFMIFAIKNGCEKVNKQINFYHKYKWNTPEIFLIALKNFLKTQLPSYMLPAEYSLITEIPLTVNGKLDKKKLLNQYTDTNITKKSSLLFDHLENEIVKVWRVVLKKDDFSVNDNFFESGGNSLLLMSLFERLKEVINTLQLTDLFKYPTIRTLSKAFTLSNDNDIKKKQAKQAISFSNEDIAIIGYAVKLPMTTSETLWSDLISGKSFIKDFSFEELQAYKVPESIVKDPNFVSACSFVEDVTLFDAEFFDIFPTDAKLMDPQHRILMELAWEALEKAGYSSEKFDGDIGVACGVGSNHYIQDDFLGLTFTSKEIFSQKDYLATKIAYKLGLTGPALNINTACSTGLVSVIKACQSLSLDDADIMLAGGATLILPNQLGYLYEEGGVLSKAKQCRPFDKQASGIIPGSGAVIFVLRKLSEALRQGDKIHAVIKGYAINNDGNDKVSFAAPSIDGQKRCIEKAIRRSNVDPQNIIYIETHGTGTKLGDSIEFRALEEVYKTFTDKRQFCCLGSIKANIGHTDAAAGGLGLLKAMMVLENKVIPPQINCDSAIFEDSQQSSFYINKQAVSFDSSSNNHYAAISAFGVGGTNAHMIIQSASESKLCDTVVLPNVLILSAKTLVDLEQQRINLLSFLNKIGEEKLEAIFLTQLCYTLQCKTDFDYKAAYILENSNSIRLLSTPIDFKNSNKIFGDINILPTDMLTVLMNWEKGRDSRWLQFYNEMKPKKLILPTYPFKRKKFWNSDSVKLNKGVVGSNSVPTVDQSAINVTYDDLKEKLLNIFCDSLGYDNIQWQDNFQDIGGDSLVAISILSNIERELGFQVTIDDIYSAPTMGVTIDNILRLPFFKPTSDHMICLKVGGSKFAPIFIIHPGNGGLFHYKTFIECFDLDRTIYGIENQIFNDSYQSFVSLEDMATCYIKRIKLLQPQGPYILAGWSFGGSVAFEMTRQLELAGETVLHVMLLDAWGKYNNLWSSRYFDWAKSFMQYDQGKEGVFIQRFNETASLLVNYYPKPVNTKIILFKAEEVDEEFRIVNHPSNHWDAFALNQLRVIKVTGTHLSMVNRPHVAHITCEYKKILEEELVFEKNMLFDKLMVK